MFAKMYEHAAAWVEATGLSIDHEWRKGVVSFMKFAEGRQAEQDAVELLKAAGYTITSPAKAAE